MKRAESVSAVEPVQDEDRLYDLIKMNLSEARTLLKISAAIMICVCAIMIVFCGIQCIVATSTIARIIFLMCVCLNIFNLMLNLHAYIDLKGERKEKHIQR